MLSVGILWPSQSKSNPDSNMVIDRVGGVRDMAIEKIHYRSYSWGGELTKNIARAV